MIKLVLNSLLQMDHAKQVQFLFKMFHAHQEFVMKLQTHTPLIHNALLIILHVKQMEEDVKLLSIALIYKIRHLVQLIHHAHGLVHVEQHQQLVHL